MSNGTSLAKDDIQVTNGEGVSIDAENADTMRMDDLSSFKHVTTDTLRRDEGGSMNGLEGAPDPQASNFDFEIQDLHRTQSRKRSRSGRRFESNHSPTGRADRPLEKERFNKALLEQYLHREQVFQASNLTHGWQHTSEGDQRIRLRERSRPDRDVRSAIAGSVIDLGDGRRDLALRTFKRPLSIMLPQYRGHASTRRTRELHISKKDQLAQAEQVDELVPIRLDVEYDQIRLRDTFTWNLHDRVIGVDVFAQQLAADFSLPPTPNEHLVRQIRSSIKEQIDEFHPHVFIEEEALDPHLPYSAYKNDEMRIVIKLNITIGQHTLVDQFEWEINNPTNIPEEFAKQMARDLSLSGEFVTAIAHSIREQTQLFTRSLYVVGHPFDGRPIEDHELLSSFQSSPLPSAFRPYQAAKEYTPCLYELNEAELEKTEQKLSREERRQKRSVNRRGGPALPDLKDRRRTIRTLLVSSVLPGAAASIEDSRIYKWAATSGKGRKGAARDGYDDFDDSDSDGSVLGSPAASVLPYSGGTRTRGVRGAASAAQVAMRANLGRSATPESSIMHHHETRASGRRITRDDSTPEPPTCVVSFKLPPHKLRYVQAQHSKSKEAGPSSLFSHSRHASVNARSISSAMGPPSSTSLGHSHGLASPGPGFRDQVLAMPLTSRHGSAAYLGNIPATLPPGSDLPAV